MANDLSAVAVLAGLEVAAAMESVGLLPEVAADLVVDLDSVVLAVVVVAVVLVAANQEEVLDRVEVVVEEVGLLRDQTVTEGAAHLVEVVHQHAEFLVEVPVPEGPVAAEGALFHQEAETVLVERPRAAEVVAFGMVVVVEVVAQALKICPPVSLPPVEVAGSTLLAAAPAPPAAEVVGSNSPVVVAFRRVVLPMELPPWVLVAYPKVASPVRAARYPRSTAPSLE